MNIIRNNTIIENNFGIKTEIYGNNKIEKNRIYNNNLQNNNQNTHDSHDNMFYGNYWDDYTGSDENYDGIGDDPYSFSSGKDHCPFMDESSWDLGVNHLPILPIIRGPSTGRPNTPYSYNFQTADPDGDDVYIYIDMGDDEYIEWEGPFESHDVTDILYYYEQIGVYTIRAKARDEHGYETDLVKFRVVIIKNRVAVAPIHNYKILNVMTKIFKTIKSLD